MPSSREWEDIAFVVKWNLCQSFLAGIAVCLITVFAMLPHEDAPNIGNCRNNALCYPAVVTAASMVAIFLGLMGYTYFCIGNDGNCCHRRSNNSSRDTSSQGVIANQYARLFGQRPANAGDLELARDIPDLRLDETLDNFSEMPDQQLLIN